MRRVLALCLGLALVGAAVWLSREVPAKTATTWTEVAPGIYRSPGSPAGYALISGKKAILIDAPCPPDGLKARGVTAIDLILLTHHHSDSLAALAACRKGATVRAPALSAPYLKPEDVTTYWKDALPLRSSRTAYLVVPEGIKDIDFTLKDELTIERGDWSIRVVSCPGHSFDHTAYLVTKKTGGKRFLFCGDALASAGKLWSPYTTDWDHWQDVGLRPTANSLRKLARLKPDVLLPSHGAVIGNDNIKAGTAARALKQTATLVDEVAFLKSYERYTRERLKDPPRYAFLAKGQAGSNGSKPWSKLSKNLWFTGNTYVLCSKDGPILVVDPWDPHSAKQIPKLQKDEKLGKVEVVLCSHAHFDHYDGAYILQTRDKPQVWTLEQVAGPIADPFRLRAPFLDARPLPVNKRLKDGQSVKWREYTLKFHFLPGQTLYTMGVETTIDGKKCLFTGDNFFHHDLYSGTGGWMGLNRSGPGLYEQSARKVLKIAPEWVLAEHGSAMEFSAADFQRRVQWGQAGTKAANALSVSGQYRHDWNPHHVRIEPVLQKAKPGETLKAELAIDNVLGKKRTLTVTLEGRGKTADQTWTVEVAPGATTRKKITLKLNDNLDKGRHVFVVTAKEGGDTEPGDAFVAVDVEAGK